MVTTLVIIIIAVAVVFLVKSIGRILTPNSFAAGPVSHVTGGTGSSVQHGSLPQDWITNPGYWWMPGNIFYDEQADHDGCNRFDDDWYTNPACSHIPGNMYHDNHAGFCTGSDWITDPSCCYMPGNIYCDDHDDTCVNSTSSWDDDHSPDSAFDNDWNNSTHFDDD